MADPEVRVRSWVRGTDDDLRAGLLGYLSVSYGTLVLDSLVLRRTAAGRFAISFPARTDRAGRRHSYIRPADDEAREAIEAEILGPARPAPRGGAVRTTDPARMSRTDRLAELGELLAAGFQRFAANAIKPRSPLRNSADQLDVVGDVEAPCGSAMESPA